MRPATTAVLCFALALLGGCPTVDLGDQPPDPGVCRPDMQYFHDVIWPQYLAPADTAEELRGQQAGCHQAATGSSALRLQTDPVDDVQNYQTVIRFLNCGTPEASRLLTYPLPAAIPTPAATSSPAPAIQR